MCYYQANYASLLRELKAALSPYGYLLTAAVHCGKNTIDYAYDFKALNEYAKLPCNDQNNNFKIKTLYKQLFLLLRTLDQFHVMTCKLFFKTSISIHCENLF